MKPAAALSLDLDDKWSYLQTRADPAWHSLPTFLPPAIDRILAFTGEFKQPITIFVVGQDAALPRNEPLLRSLSRAGHELGNHSFRHEAWRIYLPEGEADREIEQTAAALHAATGVTPTGFRAPGFRWSPEIIAILKDSGYRYDASVCPNILNPLAGLYFRLSSRRANLSGRPGQNVYGSLSEGFRPLAPYRWPNGLLELPVSTFPLLRLPVHASYLFFLAQRSPAAADAWFYAFLQACRLTRTAPNFVLHATDFLGAEDDSAMAFFPGMGLSWPQKQTHLRRWLTRLQQHFAVYPLAQFAETLPC